MLTMCPPTCQDAHNTSPATKGQPEIRCSLAELATIAERAGLIVRAAYYTDGNTMIVAKGDKPNAKQD